MKLLEPRLAPGALVVADNTSMPGLQPYLDYMRDPANGYVSVHFPVRDSDSMEISCRRSDHRAIRLDDLLGSRARPRRPRPPMIRRSSVPLGRAWG